MRVPLGKGSNAGVHAVSAGLGRGAQTPSQVLFWMFPGGCFFCFVFICLLRSLHVQAELIAKPELNPEIKT